MPPKSRLLILPHRPPKGLRKMPGLNVPSAYPAGLSCGSFLRIEADAEMYHIRRPTYS
jgi:hypothetical protein